MAEGWFIAGTDTGVGKTHAAQALLRSATAAGRRAVGMKPVAAGCRHTVEGLRSDDAEALQAASSVGDLIYKEVNPYAFAPAVSPHLAARDAGATVEFDVILDSYRRLAARADVVIVEGAGGWFAPIDDRRTMADVARALGLPVILVVGMRLGCLSHALLTAEAIARCGLPLAGWIANGVEPAMERFEDNVLSLEQRLRAPRLVTLPFAARNASAASLDVLAAWFAKSD